MTIHFRKNTLLLVVGVLCMQPAYAFDTNGNIAVDLRYFPEQSLMPMQRDNYLSFSVEQEFLFDNDNNQFTFTPYIRYEKHDSARRLIDLREALWLHLSDNWESRVGITSVFWGVAESQHLVDIINQVDLVESLDGEVKLGQPMVNVLFYNDWGDVDIYLLPYFRNRIFSEPEGRPRLTIPVDWENPQFESSKEQHHIDVALRWSHSFGDIDIALSQFVGTAREPELVPLISSAGTRLIPTYRQIKQSALELQYSRGDWLWKLEAIRQSGADTFAATVAGFEYNYVGIWGATDLGLIVEYNFDDRGNFATTPYQNDTFIGARVAANDAASSEVLLGLLVDNDDQSKILNVEAKTRLTDSWQLSVDIYAFSSGDTTDPFLLSVRNDDFIEIGLTYFY